MIYSSKDMESRAVLDTAAKICAAARTAPKTRGMDGLVTCVLTGEDKSQLAAQMRKLADELDYAFFNRDADNVDASDAVVLFGMEEVRRGLDAGCQYCHFESCADCTEKDGLCAWDAIDIGIAIGSAAAAAADARVDSRVMFSVGRAAKASACSEKRLRWCLACPSASAESPRSSTGSRRNKPPTPQNYIAITYT